jgi:hypothetical protein
VNRDEQKIDKELIGTLDRLGDEDRLDVLVYPKQMGEEFERFLQARKTEGYLEYNILKLANCIVVNAPKKVILEIAARDDVSRITINPRFTIQKS